MLFYTGFSRAIKHSDIGNLQKGNIQVSFSMHKLASQRKVWSENLAVIMGHVWAFLKWYLLLCLKEFHLSRNNLLALSLCLSLTCYCNRFSVSRWWRKPFSKLCIFPQPSIFLPSPFHRMLICTLVKSMHHA